LHLREGKGFWGKEITCVAEFLQFFALGIFLGIYGTLAGIGGGFLMVPVLFLFYHYTPEATVGTSICVVFLNTLSGSLAYLKQKRIDLKSAWVFALASIPGSILGSFLLKYIDARLFGLIFGIVLVIGSVLLLLRAKNLPQPDCSQMSGCRREITDFEGKTHVYVFSMPLGIIISFFTGFLAGALGIGGGIIHIPAMLFLLNFPLHIATATSHFILMISSLVASGTHLAMGDPNLKTVVFLGAGAVLGAPWGAKLSCRLKSKWIVRLLAFALLAAGIRMILLR